MLDRGALDRKLPRERTRCVPERGGWRQRGVPRNAQCIQLCPFLECGQPAFRGTTAGGGEGTRGEPEAKRHSTSSATLSTRRQRAKAAAATSTLDLALQTLDLSDGWVCGDR